MCCKVAMAWTLSIQEGLPFAQNNTTINGTWQLLAYLSGPCWSDSQLYRLSPIDTSHYFPWSSNDSTNPCHIPHRGFSLGPAIYPDPVYFTLSTLTCDVFCGCWKCIIHLHRDTLMSIYIYIEMTAHHGYDKFIYKLMCREVATVFLWVTLKTSL